MSVTLEYYLSRNLHLYCNEVPLPVYFGTYAVAMFDQLAAADKEPLNYNY